MTTLRLKADLPADIDRAAQFLRSGYVVALPTETVYGLAGNIFNTDSIQKIFTAKDRPHFDPLIVHVAEPPGGRPFSASDIEAWIHQGLLSPATAPLIPAITILAQNFWPGPLTLVLPKGARIDDLITAGQSTVAVRCPRHPAFQSVLTGAGVPLAAPSANRFGRISPTTAAHVIDELDGKISAVLDGGPCAVGVESTIVSLVLGETDVELRCLRPGQIGVGAMMAALNAAGILVRDGSRGERPGSVTGPEHLGWNGKNTKETNYLAGPNRLSPDKSGLDSRIPTAYSEPTRNVLDQLSVVTPGLLDSHYAPTKPTLWCDVARHGQDQTTFNRNCVERYLAATEMSLNPALNGNDLMTRVGVLDLRWETRHTDGTKESTETSSQQLTHHAQNFYARLRELDQTPNVQWIVIVFPHTADPDQPEPPISTALRDRITKACGSRVW